MPHNHKQRVTRLYEPNAPSKGRYALNEINSHHLVRVLRAAPGAEVTLFNGEGLQVYARLIENNKQKALVEIYEQVVCAAQKKHHIHLAIGASSKDTMQQALQKAVELGANEITPLLTEHCDIKQNQTVLNKKQGHWQQTLISACEQSGQNYLPKLNPIQTMPFWLDELADAPTKIMFHPSGEIQLTPHTKLTDEVIILIGPEGGFSDSEIHHCLRRSFLVASLGSLTLRFETASTVALTLIQFLSGNLT